MSHNRLFMDALRFSTPILLVSTGKSRDIAGKRVGITAFVLEEQGELVVCGVYAGQMSPRGESAAAGATPWQERWTFPHQPRKCPRWV